MSEKSLPGSRGLKIEGICEDWFVWNETVYWGRSHNGSRASLSMCLRPALRLISEKYRMAVDVQYLPREIGRFGSHSPAGVFAVKNHLRLD